VRHRVELMVEEGGDVGIARVAQDYFNPRVAQRIGLRTSARTRRY
jgi:hypothetical protein